MEADGAPTNLTLMLSNVITSINGKLKTEGAGPADIVGFRRIYQTVGCKIDGLDDEKGLLWAIELGDLTASIWIGKSPSAPFALSKGSDVGFPGEQFAMQMQIHNSFHNTPLENSLAVEITIWGLRRDWQHDREKQFVDYVLASDFAAAIVGLGLGPQFLHKKAVEDVLMPQSDGKIGLESRSGAMTIKERVVVPQSEVRSRLTKALPKSINQTLVNSPALGWLVRAWGEADPVLRFVAAFIPLEISLAGVTARKRLETSAVTRISEAILASDNPDKARLNEEFIAWERMANSVSLVDRFETVAKLVNPEGWKADLGAFRKFNRMRNALVHRGEDKLTELVLVGEGDAVRMQGLAAKYVAWCMANSETESESGSNQGAPCDAERPANDRHQNVRQPRSPARLSLNRKKHRRH